MKGLRCGGEFFLILGYLEQLEQLEQQGVDFNKSKIFIGRRPDNPYFYYFHSSDNLIKFAPEYTADGIKKLRIEFDRARFIQRLARTPCIGPQGRKGIKGIPGRAGIGAGHFAKKFNQDPRGEKLKEWVGRDWHIYMQLAQGVKFDDLTWN